MSKPFLSSDQQLIVDPFDGAKPCLLKQGKEAPFRVNPEPLGRTRGLEPVDRQAQVFRQGSRRVDSPRVLTIMSKHTQKKVKK